MNESAFLLLALYLLPTLVAFGRGHHNAGSILVINIFFGWTVIGWIVALAMSLSYVQRQGRRG